ncbi:ATP-binding cassette domain-containing protein [Acetobacteraceae bacterium H6797]|nr:ATP-binding cassette domain-containing protein [Acetobacteraceae bacterium H6797]
MSATQPLLQADNVSREFAVRGGGLFGRKSFLAVRDVSLTLGRAEVLGVVGESGCGKSTLGRLLLHLQAPTGGHVAFEGEVLGRMKPAKLRGLRPKMQMVYQDPYASLDPRRSVGAQITDGLQEHGMAKGAELQARAEALLAEVGLDPTHTARLPHEFSGGQRQRIAIARALATGPELVVADEPVSALDVSVQAQVVNLMAQLREERGLAMVFISHDLHVVRHLSDRVAVMYLGRVVEEGPAKEVFRTAAHPYTRALIAATPQLREPADKPLSSAQGELPNPVSPPSGCGFRTRCPFAKPLCAEALPPLRSLASNRLVACHRAEEI